MSVKEQVLERYSEGAKERQENLCCPVDYDTSLLKMLPQEIIEKDYGCGDPSRYVREGDTVLDLGSGGGKICYMAAHLVGETGSVIGVDMNDDMLALARKYQASMAEQLGGDRVLFHKGHIQDLALGMDAVADYLEEKPLDSLDALAAFEVWQQQQRQQNPIVPDNSVDLVVSNCVLNLVAKKDRVQLIQEIFRVLKPGGRVAISDIVSDEFVPEHLQQEADLWTGCISGAFQEKEFMDAFVEQGFKGVGYDKWDAQPWRVVEGIEFRSVTLIADKPASGARMDHGHAAMYKGPYQQIKDDFGNLFPRGERMVVSERVFNYLKNGPLADDFVVIAPAEIKEASSFCEVAGTKRPAAIMKGAVHSAGIDGSEGGCC